MAETAEGGVINHKGQVFSSAAGDAVYDSLYVADGSVMPRSLGVNPLLTITALAERCCALMARDRGWQIDYAFTPVAPSAAAPSVPGVEFTESMKGHFSTEVRGQDDYADGEARGTAEGSSFEFVLTIVTEDVAAMLRDPNHIARMVGSVKAPALSSAPLMVSDGTFLLFVENREQVDTRNMIYRMRLTSVEGRSYYFSGFKVIRDGSVSEMWPATTTLYITLREGQDENGTVLGKGILHIYPTDFVRQLTTMKAINAYSKTGYREQPTLFLEFHGTQAGVEEQARLVQDIARENGGMDFEWTTKPEDRTRLWTARHQAYFACLQLRPGSRAVSTDVCVPSSRLTECIVETSKDISRASMPIPLFGHVGDGNFHCEILIRPDSEADLEEAKEFNERVVNRALAMEGTCTGEHGIGFGKMRSLRKELGEAVDLMLSMKRAIDPENLMNPGKVVSARD